MRCMGNKRGPVFMGQSSPDHHINIGYAQVAQPTKKTVQRDLWCEQITRYQSS